MYLYKIYFSTDTNYNNSLELISELETIFLNNGVNLDGFTIINTSGYYKQEIEKSYILEYITNNFGMSKLDIKDTNLIKNISRLIKGYYNQNEVLTTKQKINIL